MKAALFALIGAACGIALVLKWEEARAWWEVINLDDLDELWEPAAASQVRIAILRDLIERGWS